MNKNTNCPKCGQLLTHAIAGTAEQEWCGQWFKCPRCFPAAGSVLVMSDALKAQNAEYAKSVKTYD